MEHPHVQLHPTNSRSAASSSSKQDHSLSSSSGGGSFATPFFPKMESLVPCPPRPTRRPSLTPTQSTFNATQQQRPTAGLVHLEAQRFPLFSTQQGAAEIRVITADQYTQLQHEYTLQKLPEEVLFPWLHGGADVPYSPASQYFGFQKGTAAAPPSYRGLTTVHAPPMPPTPHFTHHHHRSRGLTSWSSNSSTSSSSSRGSLSPSPPPPSVPTCRLVSSLPASAILSDSSNSFNLPAPSSFHTVNLRHFALQAPKYASVSDVVVYGEHGIDESVVETAARIAEAQENEWRRRGGKGVRYNVFIISDPFSSFEHHFPALVAIDSHGFSRNKLNLFEREREEMRVLTQAIEISENVWLGNTQDVPAAPYAHHVTSDSTSSLLDDGNPSSFAICIEAHDSAPPLTPHMLSQADRDLTALEREGQAFEEVRQLLENDSDSVVEEKIQILRPHVQDLVHLECLASVNNVEANARSQQHFVNGMVDLALWIRSQAAPDLSTGRLPRRVLLHCADGYTETSSIALTYIMLTRRCSAPDAYLVMQNEAERSFFVYPIDCKALVRIEERVRDVLAREDAELEAARSGRFDEALEAEVEISSCGMERSDSGYVSNLSTPIKSVLFGGGRGGGDDETTQRINAELPKLPPMELSSPDSHPWFYADTFEGQFPSRILPFLYLGNLAHASNALMLKELGITHVVSMGESALTPPRPPPFSLATAFRSTPVSTTPTNSLWLEERLGNISVLDMKNVADDGIDSIRPYIDEALAFIHEARRHGGKVLVHCRVGVSRSASIVIAYLMKHLSLDLPSSYLLTRSRRLNILIQPNLPFMATLHAFEADLLAEKDRLIAAGHHELDDDEEHNLGRAGLKRSNRLAWSFYCNEIANLNARFLC